MNYLLDTHLLLWAAAAPGRLSDKAARLIEDRHNRLFFSVASIWEITIKSSLRRPDFKVSPSLLRRGLLEHGYEELPIHSMHAIAVGHLPPLHKDPFDRMLIAQADAEGLILLTNDRLVSQYDIGAIESM